MAYQASLHAISRWDPVPANRGREGRCGPIDLGALERVHGGIDWRSLLPISPRAAMLAARAKERSAALYSDAEAILHATNGELDIPTVVRRYREIRSGYIETAERLGELSVSPFWKRFRSQSNKW
jgi:hypothetical protein